MSKQLTAIFIFMLTVSMLLTRQPGIAYPLSATAKPIVLDAEAERAIARLGDLTTTGIRMRLAAMRPEDFAPSQVLINAIIKRQSFPVVTGGRVEHLKAALKPVLAYHQREAMPIIVFYSNQPMAALIDDAVIVITTRLMISTNDAEIRGIIAHELGHEYVWEERRRAKLAKDESVMRECELFCDAVAAFTLQAIGDDPACYSKALERVLAIGVTTNSLTRKQTDSHPSLGTRQKLNAFLCQQFYGHSATPQMKSFGLPIFA